MASLVSAAAAVGNSYSQWHQCFLEFRRLPTLAHPPLLNRKCSRLTQIYSTRTECFALQGDEALISSTNLVQSDDVVGTSLAVPSNGLSSVMEVIEDIRQGKFVVVVDDRSSVNKGALVMAASMVTADAMTFIASRYKTGIVCVSMNGVDLERLQLPHVVNENEDNQTCTNLTTTVKVGTATNESASDIARTVLDLVLCTRGPEEFNCRGHILPLQYVGGGYAEASVDLVVLAGLAPAAVLCEIISNGDETMLRMLSLSEFAETENLKIVLISDLIRYREKRQQLVMRDSVAPLPLRWGSVHAYCYRSLVDGLEHVAMVKGSIGDGEDILVRMHSECLTGDIFGSLKCDCGNQLAMAMEMIENAGRGILVYLRGHEGRGNGLGEKLKAYNLMDDGRDTVEAYEELGVAVDAREYDVAAQILQDLGVKTMRLISNNPRKYDALKVYGLCIVGRVPLLAPITKANRQYLETKRTKMGHIYGSEYNRRLSSFNIDDDTQEYLFVTEWFMYVNSLQIMISILLFSSFLSCTRTYTGCYGTRRQKFR